MRAGGGGLARAAEHELLLGALAAPASRARASAERWLASVDLDALDAASTAILPGLHPRLLHLGVEAAASARLKGVHRHHWYRNRLLWGAGLALLRRLEQAGLAPVLCGGAASLPLHHRDWGARALAAIDVLLPGATLPLALPIIESAGWAPARAAPLTPAYCEARSSLAFAGPSGFGLRLHWRLCDWHALPAGGAGAWAAVRDEIDSESVRVLDPTDLLLVAAAGDPDLAVSSSLVWAVDGAAIAAAGGVDWQRLQDAAARQGVSLLAGRRLAWLRHLGVEIPQAAIAALARAPSSARQRLVMSLHRPGAEIGPAACRGARHLVRCRRLAGREPAYRGARGLGRYLAEVHGLDGAAAAAAHFLRRGVQLLRRRWRRF